MRHRRPLPQLSASPPSLLKILILKSAGEVAGCRRMSPSAPMPNFRWQSRSILGASWVGNWRDRSSIRMKSLPIPSYLANESFDIFHRVDHFVEKAECERFFGRHPVVSIDCLFDRLPVFPCSVGVDVDD